jgi:hypothetical protein
VTLRVGFGVATITPDLPCMLAGFGARSGPATDVHDDLQVRVMYAADGAVTVCLVVCDLLGLTEDFAVVVRASVGRAVGVPAANVLTSCIHTHSGPNTMRVGERIGWGTPAGYLDLLAAGACDAAEMARSSASPATLHFARELLPEGLSVNRRGYAEPQWYSVLDVRDAADVRLGVVANIAIHPVMLGAECRRVSTDWVGPFRDALEEVTGGVAIVLPGPLGDVNPPDAQTPAGSVERFDETADYGHRAAQRCAPILNRTQPAGDVLRVTAVRQVDVPVGTTLLTSLDPLGDATSVELAEWRLGSVGLLSLPGEALTGFARAVVEARGDRVLLAGLSPSWHGYLPVPYQEHHYEESMSLGEPAVNAILAALCAGPP